MKEKYIKVKNLSISEKLLSFVNNELFKNTKLKKVNFWDRFDKTIHELAKKNFVKPIDFEDPLKTVAYIDCIYPLKFYQVLCHRS